MSHAESKRERLNDFERLLMDRRWTAPALADRLGVSRQTIYNYLNAHPLIEQDEDGRYWIDKRRFVSAISLAHDEALVIYLALRRTQRHTLLARSAVADAMSKVARTLGKPMLEEMVTAANAVMEQEPMPAEREAMLDVIVKAWANRLVLNVVYRGLGRARSYEDRFRCYLIEPSLWGDGTYLIGHSSKLDRTVTYKLERIERASTSGETFEIPDNFSKEQLLEQAWGIWGGDEGATPITVRLRFRAGPPAARVRESVWHRSAARTDHPDGGCDLLLTVGEIRELLPWIRSWGDDVEVLEPESVRQEVAQQAQRLAEMYDVYTGGDELDQRLLMLWGKTDRKDSALYHPALYHLFDVAHVAQQLLVGPASPRWRNVLGAALGVDPDVLHLWLPWIIALHDIGKLSPLFQAQNDFQKQRLTSLGFDFGKSQGTHLHHTVIGWLLLRNELLPQVVKAMLQKLLIGMVAGHHGFYRNIGHRQDTQWRATYEPSEWATLRKRAIALLEGYLLLTPLPKVAPQNISASLALLNGFAILCDWLGSDETFFKPTPQLPLHDYVVLSRQRARERVASASFFIPVTSHIPATFRCLFHDIPSARDLQRIAEQIPLDLLRQPSLTIAEAPTGEGKTEFALLLARIIATLTGVDEFYIALPTMATSNAMFKRVRFHIEHRLGLDAGGAKLIHGQDFLVEDDLHVEPLDNGDEAPASPVDRVTAPLTWFAPKKRALLAPFGVGTVDQAMYTALNVPHNALRLIGLAGKVVIIDEVHAYDSYMTSIIRRLLEWLSAAGASVILLSATLPLARRAELLAAFVRPPNERTPPTLPPLPDPQAYPSVITVNRSGAVSQLLPQPTQQSRPTAIHHLAFGDDEAGAMQKARWLYDQVAAGGVACWIANTVQRAQETFRALEKLLEAEPLPDLERLLIHARMPLSMRQKREEQLLSLYGKDGARPVRGIVIGTQVLEQSLDVDFDVMASDHAPIDLLLQREGRLQRHMRSRPPHHDTARRLYINALKDGEGRLQLQKTDGFYEEYIMRQSWAVLAGRAGVDLPSDYRPLVEGVYHDTLPADASDELRQAFQELHKRQKSHEGKARQYEASAPDPVEISLYAETSPFGEDEESRAWGVAQTRLGKESLYVIPLERQGAQAMWKDGNGTHRADVTQWAPRETQLALLKQGVRLSNDYVVDALKMQGADQRTTLFNDSALLRHAHPLWLTDGRSAPIATTRGALVVYLDPTLGVIYEWNQ